MKNFIKLLYRFKIQVMFYFNLGWSEIATPIAVVRDVAIVLLYIKVRFNVSFGLAGSAGVCALTSLVVLSWGLVLKFSGLSSYANKLSNNINPELMEITEWVREQKKSKRL